MVVGDVAFCVGSARRWVASFFWVGNSAGREGVAGVTSRARTHRNMVADITVGVDATSALARIDAVLVYASLMASALAVINALNPYALRQRVSRMSWQARAHRPHTALSAVSSNATRVSPASHLVV